MKQLAIALLTFALFGSVACHDYTTGLQKSVERADEASAIAALSNINKAETTYSLSNNGEFGSLQQLTEAGLLDTRFSSPKPLRDYVLTLNVSSNSFSCNADPDPTRPVQGRHLYIDNTSGLIHINPTQPATASDHALE